MVKPPVTLSLAQQLELFHDGLLHRLPANERRIKEDCDLRRNSHDPMAGVPKVGDMAPDFALPNQHGRMVHLADRLAQGPVVLLFVRGGWCPFCSMTLRAYQTFLPELHQAGADLLAIMPQPGQSCCDVAERDLLAFPTLSDRDNKVTDRYGIGHDVEPELRPMYLRLGHDLPRLNATGNWRVPLPATFVIGSDGIVKLSHVANKAYQRLDPADALTALQALPARQDVDA